MPCGPVVGEEEHIAELLLTAIGELRVNPAAATLKLVEVRDAVAPHEEFADVLGRTHSLLAQAHLATGDVQAAEQAAMAAMRVARALGDDAGLAEVRALHESIAAEKERTRRQQHARRSAQTLADTPLADLQAKATSDLALADILIKHVGALRLHGRHAEACESAHQAVSAADRAGGVRERVLARLAVAELQPNDAEAVLTRALEVADEASETTLIGLVAKAATLAQVKLPSQYGPLMPPGSDT